MIKKYVDVSRKPCSWLDAYGHPAPTVGGVIVQLVYGPREGLAWVYLRSPTGQPPIVVGVSGRFGAPSDEMPVGDRPTLAWYVLDPSCAPRIVYRFYYTSPDYPNIEYSDEEKAS
jgi:hypothetical protein